MRLGTIACAVLSVVTLMALGPTLASAESRHGQTDVTVYNPLTGEGTLRPTLAVKEQFLGRCWGGGVAGRSSYRCLTRSSEIVDPCFAGRQRGPFYCPINLVSPDLIEIKVINQAQLTSNEPMEPLWAAELSNGQVCKKINAAWGGLGPMTCATRKTAPRRVADCRVPLANSPWWVASCQTRQTSSVPFTTYRVVRVWR